MQHTHKLFLAYHQTHTRRLLDWLVDRPVEPLRQTLWIPKEANQLDHRYLASGSSTGVAEMLMPGGLCV